MINDSVWPNGTQWAEPTIIKKTTVTEREYDAQGNLVKETITETTETRGSHNPYPNRPIISY